MQLSGGGLPICGVVSLGGGGDMLLVGPSSDGGGGAVSVVVGGGGRGVFMQLSGGGLPTCGVVILGGGGGGGDTLLVGLSCDEGGGAFSAVDGGGGRDVSMQLFSV